MKRVLILLTLAIFVVGAMLPGVSALADTPNNGSSLPANSAQDASSAVYKLSKVRVCKGNKGKHKGFSKKAKHKAKGHRNKKCRAAVRR